MAYNTNNPKYFETGSISFSTIKDTFGGRSTNIKASEYLRKTVETELDNDLTTPTIPDSVENSDIPDTTSNWSVEAFRGSNKEMVITQSGQEANVNLNENSSIWGGNLDKNIPKRLVINGTVYSTTNTSPALSISGNMQNLDVEVSSTGQIYGEGGSTNQNGGDALYIRNLRSTSPVDLYVYGKLWAGGGGGRAGNSGNSGSSLSCSSTNYFGINISSGGGRYLSEAQPGRKCRNTRSGATWYSASPTGTRNRCRGGERRGGGDAYYVSGRQYGNYRCSANWSVTCQQINYYSIGGGSAGNGGSGGFGQGFGRTKSNGNPGNGGNCNSCSGGTSCGNSGNPGSAGGDWGQAGNGGSAGAAISKRNVRIQYSTSNTIKGREVNN